MIQGGDPESRNPQAGASYGTGGPGYTIPAEILPGMYHKRGALAAKAQAQAKQQGGLTDEQKQIYSTLGGTPHLDGQYTVFGQVVEGLDVVDRIQSVQTLRGDRPAQDIVMTVSVIDNA